MALCGCECDGFRLNYRLATTLFAVFVQGELDSNRTTLLPTACVSAPASRPKFKASVLSFLPTYFSSPIPDPRYDAKPGELREQ